MNKLKKYAELRGFILNDNKDRLTVESDTIQGMKNMIDKNTRPLIIIQNDGSYNIHKDTK